MFRDDRQRARACRTLLQMAGLQHLFSDSDIGYGPTEPGMLAIRGIRDGVSTLSRGEQHLVRAVFDLWNGVGELGLWDMLANMDAEQLGELGKLITAAAAPGCAEVERWLSDLGVEDT